MGDRYEELRIGTAQEFPTTAFRVNGICDGCHTVVWGSALTRAGAIGKLKRHYRAHVKAGHSKAPGQERWVHGDED